MSRSNRRNLSRGISQVLVYREQRVRASRHNSPHRQRGVGAAWVPVTGNYLLRVPVGPTGTYGKRNDPKSMAPRGNSVKK